MRRPVISRRGSFPVTGSIPTRTPVRSAWWMPVNFILGGFLGILLLHPVTMLLYWFEFHPVLPGATTFWDFARFRLQNAFSGSMLAMNLVFLLLGGLTTLAGALAYRAWDTELRYREFLARELGRDLASLLRQGETEHREFKATLRWDLKHKRANSALEHAVVKTLAGFMNNSGGSLFLGVDDRGEPIGLENDYRTLKRPSKDGYAAYLISLVARRLGTEFCPYVHVMFHDLQGHEICRVLVEPSPKPVFARIEGDVRFYLRTGNITREMNVQEASTYIRRHWPP